jgi:chromate transporter
VGVIANLAAWFALHVIFSAVGEARLGPVRLYVPDWATLDWRAALLTVLACALVFLAKWSVVRVLVISAVGGLILSAL